MMCGGDVFGNGEVEVERGDCDCGGRAVDVVRVVVVVAASGSLGPRKAIGVGGDALSVKALTDRHGASWPSNVRYRTYAIYSFMYIAKTIKRVRYTLRYITKAATCYKA
jgi:hypothetical protein